MIRTVAVAAVWAAFFLGGASGRTSIADAAGQAELGQPGPDGAPGIVNSVAFGAVDPDLAIAVIPIDDNDTNLEIKVRFEEELRQSGRPISDAAPLDLSFRTQVIRGRFSGGDPSLGRFEGSSDGVDFRLNLWSSSQDSVFGGRKKSRVRESNLFHISAELRDKPAGRILWRGDAYFEMVTSDRRRIARSMIGPLVQSLGQTVNAKPFELE